MIAATDPHYQCTPGMSLVSTRKSGKMNKNQNNTSYTLTTKHKDSNTRVDQQDCDAVIFKREYLGDCNHMFSIRNLL